MDANDMNDHDVMFTKMLIEHCKKGIEMSTHEWHMGANKEARDMAMMMYTQFKACVEASQKWMKAHGIPEIAPIEEKPEMDM